MSYTYVGLEVTDPGSTGTTIDLTTPGSAADGDLLIAVTLHGTSTDSFDTPSGWTADPTGAVALGGALSRQVFYKIVSGSPAASYTFSGGASADHYGLMIAYRGVTAYEIATDNANESANDLCTLGTAANTVGAQHLLVVYVYYGVVSNLAWDHDHVSQAFDGAVNLRLDADGITTFRESNSGVSHFHQVGDEDWSTGAAFPSRSYAAGAHKADHTATGGSTTPELIRLVPTVGQGLGYTGNDHWAYAEIDTDSYQTVA